MPALLYEACVETLDAALAAEQLGAHRIELCSALDQDGLTPAPELIRQCVQILTIPIMVMIRLRGGDFVYSQAEIRQMESEIGFYKQSGVAGVVFGLLNRNDTVDIENTKRLVRSALPMQVTFHRAIDYSVDVFKSFQELNATDGITRVLTSGGRGSAWNGRKMLKEMNALQGRRIIVVAAGNLLPENRD